YLQTTFELLDRLADLAEIDVAVREIIYGGRGEGGTVGKPGGGEQSGAHCHQFLEALGRLVEFVSLSEETTHVVQAHRQVRVAVGVFGCRKEPASHGQGLLDIGKR